MNVAALTRPLAVVTISLLFSACGDGVTQPDGEGVTGTWTFIVDVTTETGACTGEEDDPAGSAQVALVQSGTMVQATSEFFSDGGSHTFTGTRSGDQITVAGSYQEEGALLEATYTLTVAPDENSMTGTEEWDWNSQCPGSVSDVTATRN